MPYDDMVQYWSVPSHGITQTVMLKLTHQPVGQCTKMTKCLIVLFLDEIPGR